MPTTYMIRLTKYEYDMLLDCKKEFVRNDPHWKAMPISNRKQCFECYRYYLHNTIWSRDGENNEHNR